MNYRRRKHSKVKVTPKKEVFSFDNLTVPELKDIAKGKDIVGYSNLTKKELIEVLAGD